MFPRSPALCYPQPKLARNHLYYGDNLEVLRRYNVLFAEKDGSQIHAFEDTWEWKTEAARAYQQIVEQRGHVADALRQLPPCFLIDE